MKDDYNYFVSFVGSKQKGKIRIRTFGHGTFGMDEPLEAPESFVELKEYIEKERRLLDVVITFFKSIK